MLRVVPDMVLTGTNREGESLCCLPCCGDVCGASFVTLLTNGWTRTWPGSGSGSPGWKREEAGGRGGYDKFTCQRKRAAAVDIYDERQRRLDLGLQSEAEAGTVTGTRSQGERMQGGSLPVKASIFFFFFSSHLT